MKDDNTYGNKGGERSVIDPGDSWPSRDNLFEDADDNEEFEEPDRDSDYAAVYTEVEEEEEGEPDSSLEPERREPAMDDSWAAISSLAANDLADSDTGPTYEDEEEEDWDDESYDDQDQDRVINLPLGMIVVGVVALVLLAAGGYGVMQERANLQEEIRQLQGRLGTAASPEEVARVRAASETLTARNRELEQQVVELSRNNQSLEAIIGGLETQLQAQQEALAKAEPPATEPAPEPTKVTDAPSPAAGVDKPAADPVAGSWFVNFGSYSQRSMAESWAQRLEPAAGDVVVTTGDKDGRTFYRVRVINLGGEQAANAIARQLEQDYGLPRLWVGKTR